MKFIFTLFFLISFFCPANSIAGQKLSFATDSFPPYYYSENGTAKGSAYELLRLTFNKMKIPFSLNFVPWQRGYLLAVNKKTDGIPGAAWTHSRAQQLYFPSEPLVVTEIVIFHRNKTPFQYTDMSSLKNKRIGIIRGYIYGEPFDSNNVCLKEHGESLKQNFRKLAAGRIDLVIAYKVPGLYNLNATNLADQITYSSTPVRRTPIFLAFSKKPGYERLAKKFSETLIKIKQSRTCGESTENPNLLQRHNSPATVNKIE